MRGLTPGDELIQVLEISNGELGSVFWQRLNEKLAQSM
jgi:hypothetical protein